MKEIAVYIYELRIEVILNILMVVEIVWNAFGKIKCNNLVYFHPSV